MAKKVVITGGAGFIGRRVAQGLREGWFSSFETFGPKPEVVIIDPKHDPSRSILNRADLSEALDGADTVLHLGAVSGNLYFDDQRAGIDTNIQGTLNVLDLARHLDVRRVVFTSTQSSYAHAPLPHHEDDPLSADINLYTSTKVFGEWLCKMYHRRYGLETVALRFSSVYGIGEETKGDVANPITLFLRGMLRGTAPSLYGDGYQTRDLLFVDDAAAAVLHAAGRRVQPGEVYNVSTEQMTTFRQVVSLINETLVNLGVLARPLEPRFAPFTTAGLQTEYVRQQWTSSQKLRATGWTHNYPLDEGIRIAADYYQKLQGPPGPQPPTPAGHPAPLGQSQGG